MQLALIPGPIQLPQLEAGPAEIVPATGTWAGPQTKVITAANVVQVLAPVRVARRGWLIQNFGSDGADFWIDSGANPVPYECITVPAGAEWVCPENMVTGAELRILCSVAGTKFAFREAF
ncbi:hypothetical protein [Azohydromonas aeria]|uniref:hypothetical protein n=1 Tax=Azohydromonas aeria TaxID=2590212 RepID=UPI0012FBA525|nr:hypothetical protein [Azohydromonas aeria]